MEFICIEERAFYKLLQEVAEFIKEDVKPNWKWISTEQAMRLLGVKSKTTLQRLRDNGKIRYSQPSKKIIQYDMESINDFLEKYARETF